MAMNSKSFLEYLSLEFIIWANLRLKWIFNSKFEIQFHYYQIEQYTNQVNMGKVFKKRNKAVFLSMHYTS